MSVFAPFAYIKNKVVEVASAYDADAIAYFDATGITDTALKDAVNDLVVGLKGASLWDRMNFIYPYVTDKTTTEDVVAQFSINLVNPTGTTASFFNPQHGTFDYTGFTSNRDPNAVPINASSASWMSTNFNVHGTIGSGTPSHMAFYAGSLPLHSNLGVDMGAYGSGGAGGGWWMIGYRDTQQYSAIGNGELNTSNGDKEGFMIGRYSASLASVYSNGSFVKSFASNGSFPAQPLFVGRYNSGGVPNGDPNQSVTKLFQFASFGGYLDDSEVATYTTLVETFQTSGIRSA